MLNDEEATVWEPSPLLGTSGIAPDRNPSVDFIVPFSVRDQVVGAVPLSVAEEDHAMEGEVTCDVCKLRFNLVPDGPDRGFRNRPGSKFEWCRA